MAKRYRPVVRDQPFLLPVDMREWLPGDHLVWFVLEVIEQVDTSAFHRRSVKAWSGRAGFDPGLLLGLLVYAYCRGVRSSRQIEQLCEVDVAFRVICAQDVPDHTVIARFRQAHDQAFADLFTQVLVLAAEAGLGRFGTIAVDGTKIAANASIDANRTEAWLREQVETILVEAEQVDAAQDAEHGPTRGDEPPADFADPDARAARIRAALAKIDAERAARAAIEQAAGTADRAERAAARAERTAAERAVRVAERAGSASPGRLPAELEVPAMRLRLDRLIAAQQAKIDGHAEAVAAAASTGARLPAGRPPASIAAAAEIASARRVLTAAETRAAERARRTAERASVAETRAAEQARTQAERAASVPARRANLTDPDSGLMPTRRGWIQGYNVQLAVTSDQLIVATGVGQRSRDTEQLIPMMAAAGHAAQTCRRASGHADAMIGTVLADAGYASTANLTAPGPDRLIALGKAARVHLEARDQPATGDPPPGSSPRQTMAHRLRTPEGSTLYKRRAATVEPAIGNLKKIITQFSRRGLHAAVAEIDLAATAFNLLKIHRAAHGIA